MGGHCKTHNLIYMENQILLDAIATLSGTIDVLSRAGREEEVIVVSKKLIQLVAKLKL